MMPASVYGDMHNFFFLVWQRVALTAKPTLNDTELGANVFIFRILFVCDVQAALRSNTEALASVGTALEVRA